MRICDNAYLIQTCLYFSLVTHISFLSPGLYMVCTTNIKYKPLHKLAFQSQYKNWLFHWGHLLFPFLDLARFVQCVCMFKNNPILISKAMPCICLLDL